MLSLEIEQYFHVKQALSHFAIDCPKEVQRKRQLEDKLINHDQITNGHSAVDNALCSHKHYCSQSSRVDRILARVKEREGGSDLHRRLLIRR